MPYKDKTLQAAYKKRWEQENREVRRQKADQRKDEYKKKIDTLKSTTPCKDCNGYYPAWVMQFDHIENNKIKGISELIANKQFKLCDEEIKKCELVCANCHADRTYRRLHGIDNTAILWYS